MSFLDQYDKLGNQVIADLREILLTDAAEAVKDIMEQELYEDVYSYQASELAMESRRYEEGGLADRENMISHIEDKDGLELVVENVAPFQNRKDAQKGASLSDVVQKGLPGYRQPGPRPFVSDTESECVSSGKVLDAINDGLRRKGFEIEIF